LQNFNNKNDIRIFLSGANPATYVVPVSNKGMEFSNITCHGIVSNKGMEFQYHISWYCFKEGHGVL
jgi:hypothetical protein